MPSPLWVSVRFTFNIVNIKAETLFLGFPLNKTWILCYSLESTQFFESSTLWISLNKILFGKRSCHIHLSMEHLCILKSFPLSEGKMEWQRVKFHLLFLLHCFLNQEHLITYVFVLCGTLWHLGSFNFTPQLPI